jgi:hypothetical protein
MMMTQAAPIQCSCEHCRQQKIIEQICASVEESAAGRLLAVRVARMVQHTLHNLASIAAINVAEKFANDEATAEQLAAAHDAAVPYGRPFYQYGTGGPVSDYCPQEAYAAAAAAYQVAASDPVASIMRNVLDAALAAIMYHRLPNTSPRDIAWGFLTDVLSMIHTPAAPGGTGQEE